MGRPKTTLDEDAIVRRIHSLMEEATKRGERLSAKTLATMLKIRKQRLLEILKRTGIFLHGQRVKENRLEARVNQLPIAEMIGLHMQGVVQIELRDGKPILHPQRVAAIALILPEYSKNYSGSDLESARDNALCASFLASDKMRIIDFESILPGLLDKLDNPLNPNIDFPKFVDALRSFAGFRKHGYHMHIFVSFEGLPTPSLEDLKLWAAGASVYVWNHPLVELLAPISSIDIVSFAGPGFFPLLGATNRRIREALADPSPINSFTHLWAEEDLHSALQGRLRICDALAEEGLLYGVPQNRAGEMAGKGGVSISRRLLQKDVAYGDGLSSWKGERPLRNVALGVPAPLKSKYLMQLPMDVSKEKPFIGLRVVEFKGQKVECLVAWLPQLRDMLLRALRTPVFNELHCRWVAAQERAIAAHNLGAYRDCVEIINPEGIMQVGNLSAPRPEGTAAGLSVADDMAVGMLLTAYDADSLIGRLISLRDWRHCGELQAKWTDEAHSILHQNSEKIIRLAGWGDIEAVRKALEKYLGKLKKSQVRLIRFVIEQAAVNFSRALLRTSDSRGISKLEWPDDAKCYDSVFGMMAQKMEGWWPVVGIRLDHLIRRHGKMMRWYLLKNRPDKEKKKQKMIELEWHNTFLAQPLPAKKKSATESDNLTYEDPSDFEPDEDEDEFAGW